MMAASVLMIFSLIWYYSAKSDTIVCNEDSNCADATFQCDEASDCTIICSANNACGGSIFTCPSTNKCNITCNTPDGSACQKAHFYVYNSLLVASGQNNQFENGRYICGENSECDIQCGTTNNQFNNDGMCKYALIDASKASKLNIMALGQETLRYSHIYCPEEGDCNINLIGTGTGSYKISNSAIFINDPSKVNLKLICEDNDNSPCYGDTQNAPILYCYNKTYQCSYITNNGRDWFCNIDSPCAEIYNFTTNSPTSSTINSPTSSTTNSPNTNDQSTNGNGAVIAIVIILIIICCVISAFFVYKWHKKKTGKYQGLLEEHD